MQEANRTFLKKIRKDGGSKREKRPSPENTEAGEKKFRSFSKATSTNFRILTQQNQQKLGDMTF
jgi:hypothetical protein